MIVNHNLFDKKVYVIRGIQFDLKYKTDLHEKYLVNISFLKKIHDIYEVDKGFLAANYIPANRAIWFAVVFPES